MPIVIILDDTLSMMKNLYGEDYSECIMDACSKFVAKLIGMFKPPFQHYISLYQRRSHNLSYFRRESKMIIDQFKELVKLVKSDIYGDFRYNEVIKFCDNELNKKWGTYVKNIIILLTDGGKGDSYQTDSKVVELGDKFKSIVYVVSFTDKVNFTLSNIVEQSEGACITSHSEWVGKLNADEVADKLVDTFSKLAPHFWPSNANLIQGYFKAKLKLFPFVDLNHSYQECQLRNKSNVNKNLIIEIIGFLSLADMNYPCSQSDYMMVYDSQEEDNQSSSYYIQLLNTGLLNTKSVAVCTVCYENTTSPTRFAFIRNIVFSETKYSLKFCLFPKEYEGLPWLGKFSKLTPCSDVPDAYGCGDSRTPFPIKIRDECSYKPSGDEQYQYTTWVCAPNTVVNDFAKIVRISKRLPERKSVFFKEVNRFKETALAIGSRCLVNLLCRMLEKESSFIVNSEAQEIIKYAVESLTNSPFSMLTSNSK